MTTEPDFSALLDETSHIAREAGDAILEIYDDADHVEAYVHVPATAPDQEVLGHRLDLSLLEGRHRLLQMLRSGRVRLCGNFRGSSSEELA